MWARGRKVSATHVKADEIRNCRPAEAEGRAHQHAPPLGEHHDGGRSGGLCRDVMPTADPEGFGEHGTGGSGVGMVRARGGGRMGQTGGLAQLAQPPRSPPGRAHQQQEGCWQRTAKASGGDEPGGHSRRPTPAGMLSTPALADAAWPVGAATGDAGGCVPARRERSTGSRRNRRSCRQVQWARACWTTARPPSRPRPTRPRTGSCSGRAER